MKLKQIEEIATRQVPIWQPALLMILLLLGIFGVPLIAKNTSAPMQSNTSDNSTLGASTTKEKLTNGINDVVKPFSDNLKKEAEAVLGVAQQAVTQTVEDIASKSATQAKDFVFDNTLGRVLQNINTLPEDQQNLIKKAICK